MSGISVLKNSSLLGRLGWHADWRADRATIVSPNACRPAAAAWSAVFEYIYLASFGSYYTFYLIERFQLSVRSAQIHLFLFLGAVAAGTMFGGPIGDRIGRRRVILWSILGVLPFSLALPYADLFWTRILSIAIGLILASAFSAIIVYAQELVPGRVGTIAGLYFGFAFGIAGIGAEALGELADRTSIGVVYQVCSFLPRSGSWGSSCQKSIRHGIPGSW